MRDYVAIAEEYADGVLSGAVPACVWTRNACARFQRDRQREAAGWKYRLDPAAAEHACAFAETFEHVEGEWASRSERLELQPWQVFIFVNVFGWLKVSTGYRRFTTVYVEVPRKNGKSAMVAPIGLYMLALDGEAGARVYSAATKAKQARIVFDVARQMAKRNVTFRERCGVKVQQHKLIGDDLCEFTPLEAQKLDGLNVHCALVDEVHEHPDSRVVDALDQARGARRQSLLFMITTAGSDVGGVCYRWRDYLCKVLDAELPVDDEAFFGIIYAADEGDDIFDEATWWKANPNLGVSKSLDYMRDQANKAKASPPERGAFMRKHLDVWTQVGATAFDIDGYKRGQRRLDRASFAGLGGVVGVDLAQKDDLASVVWANWIESREGVRELVLLADHFASAATVDAPGNEHLRGWADQGLIRVSPGHLIDFEAIQDVILERCFFHAASEASFDPQFAAGIMAALSREGVLCVEWRQSPMNMDPPFQLVQGLVAEGRVVTDERDQVLAWMFRNTLDEQRGEFHRPAKRRPGEKIDGVSAAVSAVGRLMAVEEPAPESVYETRGFRFVG
jgi:phage terminase large subunit-like protein